ncbi:pre-mRNA-splicing factor syf2 [Ascosphaera acerosa]|nr:pre-mRNA-splicing factor syf2 [Ascosphaera acerosa]
MSEDHESTPAGSVPQQPARRDDDGGDVQDSADQAAISEAEGTASAGAEAEQGSGTGNAPAEEERPSGEAETEEDDAARKARERRDRFRALQARAKSGTRHNLRETAAEAHRLSQDPNALNSVNRKHAFAAHNLLKADTEAAGEDFERKRAWDWTAEESARWDRRMEKKARHRADTSFADYRQDARKTYKRQLRNLRPDLEAYEAEKAAAVQRAARSGGLEIVEAQDGELVAIDRDGSFYRTADSVDVAAAAASKPKREAVDRLVADLRRAEEVRLKNRRDKAAKQKDREDGEDVTYINDKNKKFNEQLARFYNKYTSEIRESFERGTMI